MALVINLIFTIWAVLTYPVKDGLGTLHDGSCKKTTSLMFWIHLAINVLSTLLLGASNYSMQCLSSPTRNEIDKAHSKGIWLDIGVPSFRNLLRLSRYRILLWWLLAISSIPLHLLWNSAVFSRLSSRTYNVYVVSSEWSIGAPINYTMGTNPDDPDSDPDYVLLRQYQEDQALLSKLEIQACLDAYSKPFISAYKDLILVSNTSNATNSLLNYARSLGWHGDYDHDPHSFCSGFVDRLGCYDLLAMIKSEFWDETIDYCLTRRVEEHCELQFSLAIMIVVIVCNLIKAICMAAMAWKQDQEPLVTLGDAIASFLRRPDAMTAGNCIAGKTRFEGRKSWNSSHSQWTLGQPYWFRAASKTRWLISNTL